MNDNGRYSAIFLILVWTIFMGVVVYSTYMRLQHNIELMNIEFKTFEEILNGNS